MSSVVLYEIECMSVTTPNVNHDIKFNVNVIDIH